VRLAFGLSIEQAEAAFFASPAPDAAEEPLLMLPYLTGERTPNWPHASGALLGLRPGSLAQPGLIFRAALEGAAFALRAGHLRLLAAGVPEATQLLIVGGGAASPAWARVLAGAFRMPVVIAPEAEAAALGAAFCAGALAAGQGVAAFARERAPPPLGVPVLPLPEEAAYYERAFAAFVEAGEKLFGGR
jgi:xylulokinase